MTRCIAAMHVYHSTYLFVRRVAYLPHIARNNGFSILDLAGFYAYATFDIADVTTFSDANCACVLNHGVKGPPMNEVVLSRAWLSYAAGILELQDKVCTCSHVLWYVYALTCVFVLVCMCCSSGMNGGIQC